MEKRNSWEGGTDFSGIKRWPGLRSWERKKGRETIGRLLFLCSGKESSFQGAEFFIGGGGRRNIYGGGDYFHIGL